MRLGFFVERRKPPSESRSVGTQFPLEASPPDEILLAEAHRRFDLIPFIVEQLDTKAGVVFAYLGAVGVVLLTNPPDSSSLVGLLSWPVVVLFALAFLLYLTAAFASLMVLLTRPMVFPVGVEGERLAQYLALDRDHMVRQLLSDYSNCIEQNRPELEAKERWFRRALSLAFAFTGALLIALWTARSI
jgi:energy-converting hydrogenase Eha subunit C